MVRDGVNYRRQYWFVKCNIRVLESQGNVHLEWNLSVHQEYVFQSFKGVV